MSDSLSRWHHPAIGLVLAACLLGGAGPALAEDPCRAAEAIVDALTPVDLAGDESGIGGTGRSGDESGLGGTGRSGDESGLGGTGYAGDESGIGGTGYTGDESGLGGTGVYGTLQAFGSICVNGLRVHYSDDAKVWRNGEAASQAELAVGQIVWLRAHLEEARYNTRRIDVYSAVIGEIESIDVEARALRVAGQRIAIPRLGDRDVVSGGFAALGVGDTVDVSGLSDHSGAIIASRVVAVARGQRFAGPSLAELLEGLEGHRYAGELHSLSLEGYLNDRSGADRLGVGGLILDVSGVRDRAAGFALGTRVRATARIASDGSLIIERPRRTQPRLPPAPDEAGSTGSNLESVSAASAVGVETSERESAENDSIKLDRVTSSVEVVEVERVDTTRTVRFEPVAGLDTRLKVDRVDRVEKVERVDRVERIDRVERVERVEKIERFDQVDRLIR